MPSTLPVAIIGAGPYGLSLAAHLGQFGIEYRIFGRPMSSWLENMPPGMFLKSDGYASDLPEPRGAFTLAAYCAAQGVAYHPTMIPVPLETFSAYGLAFQAKFVPSVEAKLLVRLGLAGAGHLLCFEDGETVLAQRVVIAVGPVPFRYIPPTFEGIPAELAAHSSAYGPLHSLRGREVVVLGAGSSALDLAALLQEGGAEVTLLTRAAEVKFHGSPNQPNRGFWRTLRRGPPSKIGPGWKLRLYDDAPQVLHLLPEHYRQQILQRTLGPAGGYFIKDKVLGKVAIKFGRRIDRVETRNGRIRIDATGPDGERDSIAADHVVLATGYKVDLHRLDFLDPEALAGLRLVEGAPALNADYESTISGLHFIGLASALGFGPVMRFVAGAPHPARRLSRLFSKSLALPAVSVRAPQPALARPR